MRFVVARLNHDAGFPNDTARVADVRRNDGNAAAHGLHHDIGETLAETRRCQEQVARRQEAGHIVPPAEPEEIWSRRKGFGAAADRERGLRLTAVDRHLQRHAHGTRSGKALASAARFAATTPRSVMSPVTSRAGVTSKA